MAKLIADGNLYEDEWLHVGDGQALPDRDFSVGFARWHNERSEIISQLSETKSRLGVRLTIADDPLTLEEDIERFSLIVVDIETPTDWRFYSIAARLREHLNYTGELRATGQIEIDQVAFMHRCGIDVFAFNDEVDVSALSPYKHHYQSGGPRDSNKVIQSVRHHSSGVSRSSTTARRYVFVDGVIQQESF